ncbi:hematopoietic progenitor cell antigen CD34 isoform X2 [Molothrus aeneus]|uniref:hematopoietic progenitor cell antigen CD34 isoform X2 n=1 Tax=Molothrus aeneus TaxID=84833 RepID=UPI00345A98D5
MKWGQLLCIFCLLELAGCTAGSTTATPSPTGGDSSRGTAGDSAATAASTATGDASSTQPTSAAATASSGATGTSPELLGQLNTSPQPSPGPTSLPGSSPGPQGSAGVPTSRSAPTQPGHRAQSPGSPSPAAASEPGPAASSALPTAGATAQPGISCRSAGDQADPAGAVCLQLNESSTCERFLERKGLDLWQALCENRTHSAESPCKIQLTPSSLDRDCLLLILKGEKDPDKLLNTLPKSHWEKFGIESLKKQSPRGRRDSPQRTLIALVTSGLLLALLGLAGCLLMRRRSWSPAGQRLQSELIQQDPSRAPETSRVCHYQCCPQIPVPCVSPVSVPVL